jgi:predicted metal-dependent hydrolase
MKKNARLEAWMTAWDPDPSSDLPREYRAFFELFNGRQYYEAHDVLEALWLGCLDENRSFYQGLIQLAGAFVHFDKHARFPEHPVHGRRLAPGARLLDLAAARIGGYGPVHLRIDVGAVLEVCAVWKVRALGGGVSPLQAHEPPSLQLLEGAR